jgi:hypothetical protein
MITKQSKTFLTFFKGTVARIVNPVVFHQLTSCGPLITSSIAHDLVSNSLNLKAIPPGELFADSD